MLREKRTCPRSLSKQRLRWRGVGTAQAQQSHLQIPEHTMVATKNCGIIAPQGLRVGNMPSPSASHAHYMNPSNAPRGH